MVKLTNSTKPIYSEAESQQIEVLHIPLSQTDKQHCSRMLNEVLNACNQSTSVVQDCDHRQLLPFHLQYDKNITKLEANIHQSNDDALYAFAI